MREIRFRGKDIEGFFRFGSLLIDDAPVIGKQYLIIQDRIQYCIVPETIGQFTGLKDKNGKEIYEGDIVQDNNGIGVIIWFQTAYGIASYAHGYNGLKSYTAVDSFYISESKEWIVIGNIHDNLELIK